ncbi:MAG: MmgE/PrpD family protein [Bacteroidales bacterium]|jgi:2-methylcitrate dehydratase PrpD|nr:MmgE/PrpD family protein [Bacteroidales bacterium]
MNHLQTQLQKVSRWIVNLRYEDIPDEVIHFAKLNLLDCISAICAGSRSSAGIRLKKALMSIESGGPYTMIPLGESWSLNNVLYYHSAMINALELDNFVFMGHIGQSSASVSLALGEAQNVSGRNLLLAFIASVEVAGRLSANLVSGPHQGHMRAFIHRIASATVASKLYEFDEKTTANALAISLSMPEFPLYPACFSPDTKVICTSSPTVEGVKASFMAREGMEGPLDIIENPAGFFTYFSYSDIIPDIWNWLGKTWSILTFSAKNYATCAYAQGPVCAAVNLKKSFEFTEEEISNVNIYVPVVSVIMEKFSVPHLGASITPVNTHFSVIRSTAAALIFGELTGDFYKTGEFEKKIKGIGDISARCCLRHDWQMTIELLRGMDAGLENPGKPGFLSLGSSQKTFKRFKKAFGSRPLIEWNDLLEIPKIKSMDQIYFLKRYMRSLSITRHVSIKSKSVEHDFSHEGDLSKMAFNLSGRIEVVLKSGRRIESFCKLPPGFANDNGREKIVRNKFYREAVTVWGDDKAGIIENLIMNIDALNISNLMDNIRK